MKKLAIILICMLIAFVSLFKITTAYKSNPVKVVAPISTPTKVDNFDKSFLKIELTKEGYSVSLLDKSIVSNQLAAVETFISANRGQINNDKILVVGDQKTKEFESISLLLKKYGVSRFQIAVG
jgi:hypothetical protein